jgi:GTP1/Obg family GTP-binding protein
MNKIERLTLAVLSCLPIVVMYVYNMSEDCGIKLVNYVEKSPIKQ